MHLYQHWPQCYALALAQGLHAAGWKWLRQLSYRVCLHAYCGQVLTVVPQVFHRGLQAYVDLGELRHRTLKAGDRRVQGGELLGHSGGVSEQLVKLGGI